LFSSAKLTLYLKLKVFIETNNAFRR